MIILQKMLIAACFLSANCILMTVCSREPSYFQAYKDFLLNTEVDQGSDFPVWGYYLFDMNFDGIPEYLITESYSDGVWERILPEEYLTRKRELVPEENSFIDIRNTDAYVLLCDSVYELMDDAGNFHNRRMTEEEIDTLFEKWIGNEAAD